VNSARNVRPDPFSVRKVLAYLSIRGHASASDIRQRTGLGWATVVSILEQSERRGWVVTATLAGRSGRGRKNVPGFALTDEGERYRKDLAKGLDPLETTT